MKKTLNDYLDIFLGVLGICEPTDSMLIGDALVLTWRSATISYNMTIFHSGRYEGVIRYLDIGKSLVVKGDIDSKDYQVELYRIVEKLCR